ncbi:hypothetical protein CAY91_34685 [Pseudomonas aeruginosa]|nr:hypothetical protein CAY91_34685 [Pseudomonas aeruginosa]
MFSLSNSAMPRGIRLDGSSVRISCIDSGISTAPEAPWTVSDTQLTLPTNREGESAVVAAA